jgi:hypothetical protein
LTQALAPSIASAIQNSQSNQLNQGQFAAGQQINALNTNAASQNAANENQAQLSQQTGLANVDAANTAETANVGANNQVQAANTAATNTAQQAYLQQLQQQWLDQFSSFNSINDAGLGAQNNISVQGATNFGTPTSGASAYSSLGSGLAGLYTPSAAAPAAPAAAGAIQTA